MRNKSRKKETKIIMIGIGICTVVVIALFIGWYIVNGDEEE